ncbi:ABC transporter permease [Mycoplasma sp. CSL7503-lung]|uniref:ABC transporter permease n=1 Tax=Mycoplasma sp. CSL7503-lung TaxID=536372 RepID=UPI0021D2C3ED|nr:ABC transporter permease [Mycoplasma sp. CSL7503-lung]MCU4706701.1 ABC transporter permease [Mycoplasma sp. CSL7503-lung]
MKNTKNYIQFLHKVIMKKKNSIIIPIIIILLMLIMTIVFSQINLDNNKINIIFYITIAIQLIFTIFFSSLKSINIFKDLSEDGLGLLTFSKPLSRKNIIFGKIIINIIIGLYWTMTLTLLNILFVSVLNPIWIIKTLYTTFLTIYLSYILFGNISLLIAYWFNSKIALTLPVLLFSPLAFGGTLISGNTTSVSDNFAFYLNTEHKRNPSGNLVNAEVFYLNNNSDNFYIVPNGMDNKEFREDQKIFLNEAYKIAKNAPKSWQIYSLLSTPYQMLDIFNYDNANIFNLFSGTKVNNLEKYLNYNNNESFIYNYSLKENSDLDKYKIQEFNEDGTLKRISDNVYLVPGLLKNKSNIPGLENRNIIYAREKADSFKFLFPEDQYVYSSSDNLVGEIKWNYLRELLSDKVFVNYVTEFYNDFINTNNNLFDQRDIKVTLLSKIEQIINDESSDLNRLETNSTVLNSKSLQTKEIKNITEKKIYLSVAILYYAYFNFMNTKNQIIVDSILINPVDELEYTPSQLSLQIGDFKYSIGGYSQYTPKQEIGDNNKIIIRYELTKSDNYLFQTSNEVFELSRTNVVVEKKLYWLIWIAIIGVLITINSVLYYKKDYK